MSFPNINTAYFSVPINPASFIDPVLQRSAQRLNSMMVGPQHKPVVSTNTSAGYLNSNSVGSNGIYIKHSYFGQDDIMTTCVR